MHFIWGTIWYLIQFKYGCSLRGQFALHRYPWTMYRWKTKGFNISEKWLCLKCIQASEVGEDRDNYCVIVFWVCHEHSCQTFLHVVWTAVFRDGHYMYPAKDVSHSIFRWKILACGPYFHIMIGNAKITAKWIENEIKFYDWNFALTPSTAFSDVDGFMYSNMVVTQCF